MYPWKYSIFAALCIVPDLWFASLAACYPTDVTIIEAPNKIAVCEKCRPGYQASRLCLDHFYNRSYRTVREDRLKYLYPNYAIIFPGCTFCPPETYSETNLWNNICRRCSYCQPGDIVQKSCSITSDTVCLSYWNHTWTELPISSSVATNSTKKYEDVGSADSLPSEQSVPTLFWLIFLILLGMSMITAVFVVTWRRRKRHSSDNETELVRETCCNDMNDRAFWDNDNLPNHTNDATSPESMDDLSIDVISIEQASWDSAVWESIDDQFHGATLQISKKFDYQGGALEIVGSSVRMKVPRGAINHRETTNIDCKIKLCRPNDWKSLQDCGYTTALPQIELGPSGTKFNKPIEIVMESSAPFDAEDDVAFEFTEGSINEKSEWLPAVKCNSRKEAKSMALTKSPHVAFFAGERVLTAYYLHFTGGRMKRKVRKQKWVQSSAFVRTNKMTGERLEIKVVFHADGKDEKTLLSEQLREFSRISGPKPIKLNQEEPESVKTVIYNTVESWMLSQGDTTQTFPISSLFDPEYAGCFPSVDYVFCNQGNGVTHFECVIDIMNGTTKIHDHKVNIDRDFIQEYIFPKRQKAVASAGYHSISHNEYESQYTVDDSDFKSVEPRKYIQSLFTSLSEYMAGYYKRFARHLGIQEYEIDRVVADYPSNSREACAKLLTDWLRTQPDNVSRERAPIETVV